MRPRAQLLLRLTLLFAILLGGCAGGPASEGARRAESGNGDSGEAAPEVSFTTFEGGTFSLAEQRGTPVVLNFWESW